MTWNPGLSRIHFCEGSIRRGEGAIFLGGVFTSLHSTPSLTIGTPNWRTATSKASEAGRANPYGFIFSRRLLRSVCYEPTENSSEPRLEACGSPRRPPRKCLEAEWSKGRALAQMLSSKRAQSNTICLVLGRTFVTPTALAPPVHRVEAGPAAGSLSARE